MSVAPATIYPPLIRWLRRCIERAGIAEHATARIIQAEQDGVRPVPPFVTIRPLSWEDIEGITPDTVPTAEGDVLRFFTGGTVSLQAYGEPAIGWLRAIRRGVHDPACVELARDEHLAIRALGGVINLSAVLDTSHEPRAGLDLAVRAAVDSLPLDVEPAEVVQVDPLRLERYDDASDPLTGDLTIPLDPE